MLAAIVLLIGASSGHAQSPALLRTWSPQAPAASPSARYIHAITYDALRSQTVLFGGFGGSSYLNDTWTWDGTTWTQQFPATSPSARAAHAMAYDAAHGNIVLFGGLSSAGTRLGDTWLWNGKTWTQASPANNPEPRDGTVMVYDAAHGQVVMFGGTDGFALGDTWIWDGSNWTQVSTPGPPARDDYGMVYDAARGQVVLFGGMGASGNYLNDTWIWNGAIWTQASPASQPPARYAQGMAYDAVAGQTIMWGGNNGSFLNDTWAWDGSNWIQQTAGANIPSGRYAPNAVTYDQAREQIVLFGGLDGSQQYSDTWNWGLPVNFGNVCAGLCNVSKTQTLTYSLTSTTTFGAPRVVTQGASQLDFSLQSNTCTTTIAAGKTCAVQLAFKPLAPGLRQGAVQLLDSGGNVLTTTPVYGVGQAPAVAYSPGTQSDVNSSYPLYQPKNVAVDAAGDVYIANTYYGQVVRIGADGTQSTVGTNLQYPQGMAVDGAGNVFIADNNLNQVVEVPAGCTNSGCQQVWAADLRSQLGVAVDGAGNLFVGDFLDGIVKKYSTTTGAQTVVYQPGAGSNPVGVAVDGAGDLFVADFGRGSIIEVPAGCTSSACQFTVGSGWSEPEAVSVDAAGDIFVADAGLQSVVEIPAGCASSSCQVTVASGVGTFGAAVDSVGNVFIADVNLSRVLEVNRSQAPSFNFASTYVGSTSADSPQSITIRNIGNQALTAINPGLEVPAPNFAQVPGPGNPADCTAGFALSPGGACALSISFTPATGPSIVSAAVLTDNALNGNPISQTVNLSGVGIPINFPINVTAKGSGSGTVTSNLGAISCAAVNGSASGICSASYQNGTLVTLTASAAPGSAFTGWGGDCAAAGTSATCNVAVGAAVNLSASFVQQSFGNVNVCPAGQSTPAPCSNGLALAFTMASDTNVGVIQVVTQGNLGLDFGLGSSTCTGTILAGNSCSVNVTFSPLAPGLREGAVQLFDTLGNLVATLPVYGVGQSPAMAFGSGVQSVVNTGAYVLSQPMGVAVDAAGNLFIADTGTRQVVKLGTNGTQSTMGTGLQYPQGVAVDGAGNLFIADNNRNQIVEVPAGCTNAGCQKILASNLRSQLGVAVNGAGDVFAGDFLDGEVVKIAAVGGAQTVVYNPGPGSNPLGMAVNAAGDLFITDFGRKAVVRIPQGCADSSCQTMVGTGWSQPDTVAVDAAGNVYVADFGLQAVVEVPAGCASSSCQIALATDISTYAATVDNVGNVYIADRGHTRILKLNRSQPPSLNFATTNAGSTSADSPQAVSVQNTGNQPLTGSVNLNLGASFAETSACASAFPLAPGAACSESFSFTPTGTAYYTGTATFSDNTGNLSPLVVLQTINLSGNGGVNGVPGAIVVPNVVGMTQDAATSAITSTGLTLGTVSTGPSSVVPTGSVSDSNPAAGTQVAAGSAVKLLVSNGLPLTQAPNPLSLLNNYFVTGDYYSAGVTLRGLGQGGTATGTITIPSSTQAGQGVPDGSDILAVYLYWETVENTPSATGGNGTFRGYQITGQQIGSDQPYSDGALSGTLRVYRADVNAYLPGGANGVRLASGAHTISLPDGGGAALPLTEGASLVVIYRALSPNFPLKAVVIYDGSGISTTGTTQLLQGFYDAAGGANGTGELTTLSAANGAWNNSVSTTALGQPDRFTAQLNPGAAYAAVILSTPVNNSDNDAILDAWKAGPLAADFHSGQPGYYDVKTGSWVGLPGAKHGQKDLFVQLDYMCGALLPDGSCDPAQENLFPAPDAQGHDPLQMVKQAFASHGVQLHLEIGNAIPEDVCTDNASTTPPQLCQFPGQKGVISWKNSLMFSKLWPRNVASCITGGDCTTRFPYGQKDSYHYVLFGHSLALPAWNARFGTLTSIQVANQVTTITTADRGDGINKCPSRITLSGVLGNSSLNGIYNTTSCPDTKTIIVATPGVPNWSYPNNTLSEPVLGLTSGTITSISGYSDLGGSDSAVTLGLWATAPKQDMSKRANVTAGTLFHEIGHTLGLSHGGLYYDTAGSYVPTFDPNCKPNYQSVMNYLFQLDLLGPNQALDFSNQVLNPLNESTAGTVTQLTDSLGHSATFPTSAWYVPWTSGTTASPATRHCDGTPLNNDSAYRVDAPIAPIDPAWANGQDINFDGQLNAQMRGYNDWAGMDLRQVGATGGQFASLAPLLSFGSLTAPMNVAAGGNVTLGSGGTITLGSGGNVTLGSGGNVTLGSGGTITLGSGGNVTLGSGGNVTLGSGGTITLGSGGNVTLGSGGNVTLGSGGTITLGSGGNVTLGSGGNVTLGSGGTITLGSGGIVTIPSTGGSYALPAGGGTITLGSGGNVTLGSGGNVTLGSGGNITLGSGGNVTLGSGGNVTLGSGGTITLGSGGNVTLGSGGNVTLGSGGTVTLGSGGAGCGGIVTLGSGGNVTLGSGGTVTLGSGGNVTLGSGGNVTLGSGGTIILASGGAPIVIPAGGNYTLPAGGGNITLGSGGNVTLGSGGNVTLGSGGTITLGSGGNVTLGSGGNVTLGSGGTITMGSGGTITLGSGGNVTLGSGGNVTLGSGGNVTLGSGGNVTLGSGGLVALGSGGNVTLGSGGNITLGSGGVDAAEMTYDDANSVVRPPALPTETPGTVGVRVDWQAPAFGVVETYTIYRSSDGAPPIAIGSVSGVNGNPPATSFTDLNPDLTSKTVIYTISTTLVPDVTNPQPRQSPPSPPAVLKNDQTITLSPLPSSVIITDPQPVITATSLTGGVPNGLQVNFLAAGSCSIGSQSMTNNVSSATLALNSTGSCIITASQGGTNSYNAANTVSGTFAILPQGSNLKSQTISFASLPNVPYGSAFSLSATSSSGLPVSFQASGPCTAAGTTTGVGLCAITASSPGNNTYSAASEVQSFTVIPAVLKVTANNLAAVYGQSIPTLTYTYTGFVNGDTASAISGAPALSTTGTAGSNAGLYPITVSTGSLAAANYSFLYVSGSLTIQRAGQAITFTTGAPSTAAYNTGFGVAAAGGGSGNAVTFTSAGACSNAGATYTMTSGAGTCSVIANQAGNTNYAAATQVIQSVNAIPAAQAITFTTKAPATAAFNSSFTVVAAGGASGNPVIFTSSGACGNTGATYTMTNSAGTCGVIANQAGNTNYAAASQVMESVTATGPVVTVSMPTLDFGTVYLASITSKNITVTNSGTASVTIKDPFISIVQGGNSSEFVALNLCPKPLAAGKSCIISITFVAGPFYTPQTATLQLVDDAPGSPQTVALTAKVINPVASFSATAVDFGSVKARSSKTLNLMLRNTGTTPLIFNGAGIGVTGTNAAAFTQTNNCTSSVAAGATCTIAIKFTPPATGSFSANLTVLDNAHSGGGSQSVALTGKGN